MMHSVRLFAFVAVLLSAACVVSLSDAEAPAFVGIRLRRGRTLAATRPRMEAASENADGSCWWDEDSSLCHMSRAAAAERLRESDNAYAQTIANVAACESVNDAASCAAIGNCVWDPQTFRCMFVAYNVGHEDSICIVDAPAHIKSLIASEICATHTTQLSCMKDPDCTWDQMNLECSDNGVKFYFGLTMEQIIKAADGVISYKLNQLQKIFDSKFDTEDPDFDWGDVLEWKAPDTDCPEWSHSLICTYADTILEDVAVGFYCGEKYSEIYQFKDCIRDPICEFRMEAMQCKAPAASYAAGAGKGLQKMIDLVGRPIDKEIGMAGLECAQIADKDECTGGCLWQHDEERCGLSWTRLAEILASPGKNGTDVICTHATALASSDCLDLVDTDGPEACTKAPNCQLQIAGDCTASPEYMISFAAKLDPALDQWYNAREAECTKHKDEASCNRA